MPEEAQLQIQNLRTSFYTRKGTVHAVDGVDFSAGHGRILAIVGESGCGKTVLSLSILQLLSSYAAIEPGSKIFFQNENLIGKPISELRNIRGSQISMIFQDPMTALNPVMTIEQQLIEVIRTHRKTSKKEASLQALEMLKKVGIPAPEQRMKEYPFQLSGGMKQRVMIAMALLLKPTLLIADEPTTALDVTIQAQILELLRNLRSEYQTTIILITHDMGVVASMADDIAVMYAGQIVEYGKAETVFTVPRHPYTAGLLKSIPRLDLKQERLYTIKGTVPNQYDIPTGCRFCPRCEFAQKICQTANPELRETDGRLVRCHLQKPLMKGDQNDIGN